MHGESTYREFYQHVRQEWQLFRLAVMFYTRLPVGAGLDYSEDAHNRSTRYFPLVGGLVGLGCGLVYLLAEPLTPVAIAVVLSTVFGIWLTGAFHEDGLADTCDGLGGGWDKARILDIMKDSRVGTYGLVGLVSVLAIKCLALTEIAGQGTTLLVMVVMCGHVLSRWSAVLTMHQLPYVRLDESSKSKPVTKALASEDFRIASVTSLAGLLLLPWGWQLAALGMLPPGLYLYHKLKQWLGGYTGDGLGAMQQVTEAGFYLAVVVLV